MSPRTLIIGGTKGVGRAAAHLLAGRGHRLALAYSSDSEAARKVAGELGDGLTLVQGDVAGEGADIVERAAAGLGGLDNVIVAAVPVITGRLSDMTDAQAQRAYDVNVTGFRHATLAARPHLAEPGQRPPAAPLRRRRRRPHPVTPHTGHPRRRRQGDRRADEQRLRGGHRPDAGGRRRLLPAGLTGVRNLCP